MVKTLNFYSLSKYVVVGLAALAISLAAVGSAAAATSVQAKTVDGCQVIKPKSDFYAGGRVASELLTTPASPDCTTISVMNIKDPGNPDDHCQTFLVGFFPEEGEPTYTEPVEACSEGPHGAPVVLATDVPDNTTYRILYQIDYLGQDLQFRAAH